MANASNTRKNAAEACVNVEFYVDPATDFLSIVIIPRAKDGRLDLTSGTRAGAHSLPIGSQSTMLQAAPPSSEVGSRRQVDVPGSHFGSPAKLASLLTNIERDSFAVAASVKAMLDSIQSVVSQRAKCTLCTDMCTQSLCSRLPSDGGGYVVMVQLLDEEGQVPEVASCENNGRLEPAAGD
ncbi:hypothetical protein CYMTET_31489 [Cymbomonas tetramitiformis]|uniref:Uncharacterized protein n=1 Tax=Cymbomonas tetramitiformis TaxID=36881 RepID=A0AAE0KST8_9CHLO|nr:hypothetical protein CYMTET_31489 [Cymbomonas tetramitiformis]